jgi:L-alanine-DL-glutamate epimerase-like enolase superfamily enzyme
MALWDLIGQATRQPLYRLLGGAAPVSSPVRSVLVLEPSADSNYLH